MHHSSAHSLAAISLALSLAACSSGTAAVSSDSNGVDGRDQGNGGPGKPSTDDPSAGDENEDEPPSAPGEDSAPDEGGGPTYTYCGNGRLEDGEACDDGNAQAGDGCDKCAVEPGWKCSAEGDGACVPAACGDGIIAGVGALAEECEDGNAASGDGCSRECKVEPGFVCDEAGCRRTVCGDSKVEGSEACDDGNDDPFDACGECQIRPKCGVGPCEVVCGDGMIFPSEECDDGNTQDGDGCSSKCELEPGFKCEVVSDELGDTLELFAVFRDFVANASTGNAQQRHPDFYDTVGSQGVSYGMVEDTLDAYGHPVYTGVCEKGMTDTTACKGTAQGYWQTHSKALFDQWYQGGDLAHEVVSKLTLTRTTAAMPTYSFDASVQGFFPLDNAGWVLAGAELPDPGCTPAHNFGFTTEVRDWFVFRGGESLTFSGDDDVWVFIGGKLALDLGGVHGQITATINLSLDGRATCTGTSLACVEATRDLGLVPGQIYEIALFHAERRGCGSNFRLDVTGFERARSVCEEVCGDGVVTRSEECDDANTDDSDTCTNDCKLNIVVK